MGIRYSELKGKFKAAVDDALARDPATKPKRIGQGALEHKKPHTDCMVNIPGKVLIWITRIGKGEYDTHDNLRSGCKSLVDAICAAIGKQGDSKKDGVEVEYAQKKGEPETIIEIYELK